MPDEQETHGTNPPILRLRPTVPTELIRPRQRIKQPDGPWIAHPDLIDDDESSDGFDETRNCAPDITMNEYREAWKAHEAEKMDRYKTGNITGCQIMSVVQIFPSIDMQKIQGKTEREVASATERHYVGAHHYLTPGSFVPSLFIDRFGKDWQMNARGIYYRHHFSPGWITADHSLWLPSLDGIQWSDCAEEGRRIRAKSFLKHVLDNEKWKKSEYAWDADAWTDVFGLMRNDAALSVDKREYNTIGQKTHDVSCLLTGASKFIWRVPDATFGLATFQPSDYQTAVAEWDLDRDRLEALLLHRKCGLISDPRWGETSLVFPFAVYEAKGWSGDAREARMQGCSAGKVYLDLLDNLAREPGKIGKENVGYQTDQSRNSQVFVFTSFGAHWHILVGYKRPRLKREHAGYQGMSESVYVFQRIWSSRVTTERSAWELLSLVDQIHLWGVTDFRDFVIRHLTPWHDFAKNCYINDVKHMNVIPGAGKAVVDGEPKFLVPSHCLRLPQWTKHVKDDARLKFQGRVACHLQEAWIRYRGVTAKENSELHLCSIGRCDSQDESPEPLYSTEEYMMHLRDNHGADDAEIVEIVFDSDRRNLSRLSSPPFDTVFTGDLPTRKKSRKRGPVDTVDNMKESKRCRQ